MKNKLIIDVIGVILVIILLIILMNRYYPIIPSIDFNLKQVQPLPELDFSDPLIYDEIYENYPSSASGRDIIYRSISEGDIDVANDILNNIYTIPRFEPIEIKNITWEEDPYEERYWRFLFYGFDPATNLLYAAKQTRNKKEKEDYYNKLIEITNSFIDNGMNKTHSWDDFNGVAFRTMILINIWWRLREENMLSQEESNKILNALKIHGDFLLDDSHFQPSHNHGINEATALFLLSINFPDIPGADEWLNVSKSRIDDGLYYLIDDDGALIENSPYYHFYALEKYWNVYKYTKKYNLTISDILYDKIKQMAFYGTYILQPNLEIPLLGASIKRKIRFSEEYKEITMEDPYLLYVLTQGKEGKVPQKTNIYFPSTGQTILRSGWGKGEDFANQTQLIFDVGKYRTTHSHLDALSFNLFWKGINLMPDSGLYSYEKDSETAYFTGTSSHNTVIVDNIDQKSDGNVFAGEFLEGDGYSYQSGEHSLYPGVSHKRAIMLIEEGIVLIIDELNSDTEHNYEQVFHLFPEAEIKIDNLTVSAYGEKNNQLLTIHQLLPEDTALTTYKGENSPTRGFCSFEYKSLVSCYMLSYSKKSKNASFITILELGEHSNKEFAANISDDGKKIQIKKNNKVYNIQIERSSEKEREITVTNNNFPETMREQKEGAVVIVFDDGSKSILSAVEIMENYGFKGNIGVIGKYTRDLKNRYLSLKELKNLQDIYGWNIISHSFYHQNAVSVYHQNGSLEDLENDIIKEIIYLNKNGINSAPNWYIYPQGATNEDVEKIVGKYYKFARITQYSQEKFPFEDPLEVKALSVTAKTTPEEISKAVSEAKKNNLTLFLTFHKICSSGSCDKSNNYLYSLDDFKKIIQDISNQGIKVKTLSEFDSDNGISFNNVEIIERIPEQIVLKVNMTDTSYFRKIVDFVNNLL